MRNWLVRLWHGQTAIARTDALPVDEVFVDAAYNLPHTFVARPVWEKELADRFASGGPILMLSGPSKTGKTVLCNRLDLTPPPVYISVIRNEPLSVFWDCLRHELQQPSSIEHSWGRHVEVARERRRSLALSGAGVLEAKGEAAYIEKSGQARTDLHRYEVGGVAGIIGYLRNNPHTVIVDDAHWLTPGELQRVVEPFKQLLGTNTRLILISVPVLSLPPTYIGELRGRFAQIAMPHWTDDELAEIARKGFGRLNIRCDDGTIARLARHSYGSPQVMQGLCRTYCSQMGIAHVQPRAVDGPSLTKAAAGKLAAAYAADRTRDFDTILAEDTKRTFATRDNRNLSLAELAVLGVSHRNPLQPYPLADLIHRLEERVLRAPSPPLLEANIARKLLHIERRYTASPEHAPPIQYDEQSQMVTVLDPYFKIWARWVKGETLAGSLFARGGL